MYLHLYEGGALRQYLLLIIPGYLHTCVLQVVVQNTTNCSNGLPTAVSVSVSLSVSKQFVTLQNLVLSCPMTTNEYGRQIQLYLNAKRVHVSQWNRSDSGKAEQKRKLKPSVRGATGGPPCHRADEQCRPFQNDTINEMGADNRDSIRLGLANSHFRVLMGLNIQVQDILLGRDVEPHVGMLVRCVQLPVYYQANSGLKAYSKVVVCLVTRRHFDPVIPDRMLLRRLTQQGLARRQQARRGMAVGPTAQQWRAREQNRDQHSSVPGEDGDVGTVVEVSGNWTCAVQWHMSGHVGRGYSCGGGAGGKGRAFHLVLAEPRRERRTAVVGEEAVRRLCRQQLGCGCEVVV